MSTNLAKKLRENEPPTLKRFRREEQRGVKR
jgi:hypothetical protein